MARPNQEMEKNSIPGARDHSARKKMPPTEKEKIKRITEIIEHRGGIACKGIEEPLTKVDARKKVTHKTHEMSAKWTFLLETRLKIFGQGGQVFRGETQISTKK